MSARDVDDPVGWPNRSARSSRRGPACRARSASATTSSAPRSPPASASRRGASIALTESNWMAVMGDRGVDALWGVGPKTAKKLAGLGITTVADLAATDATLLTSTFGPTTGLWILLLAKGGGDTNVSAEPWVPRSRSHVVTFPQDLTDRAEIDAAVVDLARQTLAEIVDAGPRGHPGRRDGAHQDVLHPDQDPQAARRRAPTASVITQTALRPARPVRTRPAGAAARRAARARCRRRAATESTRAIPSPHAAHDRHPGIPLAARDRDAAAPAHRRHRRQRHRQVLAVPRAAAAGRLRRAAR